MGNANAPPRGPGTPGSSSDVNPFDDLTDQEKARILRKHLVPRDERESNSRRGSMSAGSDAGRLSEQPSTSQLRVQREDTDPFPVPYHAPGADIT